MKKRALFTLIAGMTVASVLFMAFKSDKSAVKASEPYILVEIYEIPSYKDKGVHIHYGGVKREYIPFKEFNSDNHDENGDITLNAINKLVEQGYVIESTSGGMTGAGIITKVFMRKQ